MPVDPIRSLFYLHLVINAHYNELCKFIIIHLGSGYTVCKLVKTASEDKAPSKNSLIVCWSYKQIYTMVKQAVPPQNGLFHHQLYINPVFKKTGS